MKTIGFVLKNESTEFEIFEVYSNYFRKKTASFAHTIFLNPHYERVFHFFDRLVSSNDRK